MLSEQQCLNAKILIVDDQLTNIMLLENILQAAGYTKVESTTNSSEVLERYRVGKPDLLLLDIRMPELDGFQVMGQLKIVNKGAFLPILVLTSEQDRQTRLRALEAGAKDFINKPFDQVEVLMRIRNLLEASLLHSEISRYNQELEKTIKARTSELRQTQYEVVQRLGRAAEYRDSDTGLHIVRMSHYAALLGQAAGMNDEECELLRQAMPMHDIGKIGIPDRILLKSGKLTDEEWEIMKTHPRLGAELLSGGQSALLQMGEIIALTHHEKWDGTGYPNKLSGEDIPLPGRICALCDVFDALTSERPYKEAWPIDKAADELQRIKGTHLDPHLVDLFDGILPVILEIKETYSDASFRKETLMVSM